MPRNLISGRAVIWYLVVPLDCYKENTTYWGEKVEEVRANTLAWGGRKLSIFARATVCNTFLVARLWYVMQVLSCTRVNVQKFHRAFAVLVWQSSFERTSRNNLFRSVGEGGLGVPHLFVKQLVSRFMYLRDQSDPFVRTCLQILLSNAIPDFIVSCRLHVAQRKGLSA